MKTTMKKTALYFWKLVWGNLRKITNTEYHADGITITITHEPK